MSNEAFDIWLKENYLHTNPPLIEIWQAAKADSEQKIADLKAYKNGQAKLIHQQNAHINVLREALEYHTEQTRPIQKTIDSLASTPAQSLQAHDNEVIEKCAKVCDGYTHGAWFADKIRALKGK